MALPPFFGLSGFYETKSQSPWVEIGSYYDRLKQSFLAWVFRSQRKSFFGLWPGYFWHRLLGRKVVLRSAVELPSSIEAPHPRPLHYEYRFKVDWQCFHDETMKFVTKFRSN